MKKEPKMTKIAPMYVYATEMVAPYYRALSVKGKRVLTVAGSGDQVLNALYFGASVVAIDINQNALFFTELKIAAVKSLSYREFLAFFSEYDDGFDYALYLKFRQRLSKPCRLYFDGLYKIVGNSGLGSSRYFRQREHLFGKNPRGMNAYLSSAASYAKMRKILYKNKPAFWNLSLLMLSTSKIRHRFDIINLSNVPNYLTGRTFQMTEEEVLAWLVGLNRFVAKNGCVFFYGYNSAMYGLPPKAVESVIAKKPFLAKLKASRALRVTQKSFKGITGKSDRITILQYGKKRSTQK